MCISNRKRKMKTSKTPGEPPILILTIGLYKFSSFYSMLRTIPIFVVNICNLIAKPLDLKCNEKCNKYQKNKQSNFLYLPIIKSCSVGASSNKFAFVSTSGTSVPFTTSGSVTGSDSTGT